MSKQRTRIPCGFTSPPSYCGQVVGGYGEESRKNDALFVAGSVTR